MPASWPATPVPVPLPGGAVRGGGGPGLVPRELPPPPRSFTARSRELEMLDGLLAGEAGTTVVISAVSGTAGIGKTTLAVHWGHRVAARFPDGQLYVNLRGHDPVEAPMSPEAALREFLTVLDMPPEKVPQGLAAQSALFRSLLAGRRMLVVLDNAHDAAQVRPLLPASPGCMAVVTSRERLTGLVATAGAHLINLDLLTTDEARRLLTGRLGEHRVAAEPDAADRIIGACSHLPLALAIAAARALTHPGWSLEKLAAELAAARLDALTTGDPAADARAVFSWSYRALTPPAAALFRLLGLHPGPDFGAASAASLLGVPDAVARDLLDELVRAQMAGARGGGRCTFHDLLRAYARELTEALDGPEVRRAALARLYDGYVRTGQRAHQLLFPQRPAFDPPPGAAGPAEPEIADGPAAERWYAAERAALHAAVPQAAATGHDHQAWQLAYLMAAFLDRAGDRQQYADVAAIGLAAAERRGDRWAQALLVGCHGMAQRGLGNLDAARTALSRAAELFEAEKNRSGVGVAELELGRLAAHTGDVAAAMAHARRALAAFADAGDRAGAGKALNNLGWYRYRSGDFAGAAEYGQRALEIQRGVGYRRGMADALDTVGVAAYELGDLPRAIACLTEAVAVSHAIGDRIGAAECLLHLGDSRRRAGDLAGAREAYTEALAILTEAGDPDAVTARDRLRELTAGPPLPPPV
jgi:tetratricopeptide (TPR) repeat protein